MVADEVAKHRQQAGDAVMNEAPPDPPGSGLVWQRHEDFVDKQIAAALAHMREQIDTEPDQDFRAFMRRNWPRIAAQTAAVVRLHYAHEANQ